MTEEQDVNRDLAALPVPLAGALQATGDPWEPYRIIDAGGEPVAAVAEFFRDLQAAGRSEATLRSYGHDLLRWFRFIWAAGVPWNRATRIEARDFCRWMLVAGKPSRPHWRSPDAASAASGEAYAPSVRAHSETVLRCFYQFHLEAGSGPVINPFPLDRTRRGGRAHAHHNPMEPFRHERSGLYRPRVPSRIPRSVPDEEFNEIFARLPSHRDRALVAFYVSTGARASELLSATLAGVDPGRQVITVTRKGTRELQELPASTDAFVWLRLYQVEMEGLIPKGRRQPLWWTLRRPVRPLTYHAVHRMFERAGEAAGSSATLHSLRHTAAYRMAEDPALPLTDVQTVLGHVLLTTTQIYLTPRKEEVIRRVLAHHAEQTRQAAQRAQPAPAARLPARDDGRAVRGPHVMTGTVMFPGIAARPSKARRESARTAFPPRPGGHGLARHQAGSRRGLRTAHQRDIRPGQRRQPGTAQARPEMVPGLAVRPAGRDLAAALDGQRRRRGGRELAGGADRLAARARPGIAVAAGRAVRRPGRVGLRRPRPSLAALPGRQRAGKGALTRSLARTRDPEGFARLQALCDADPHVSAEAVSLTLRRTAEIIAAKGGMVADITVGDVLELMDREAEHFTCPTRDHKVFYRMLREMGIFGDDAPERLRAFRTAGQLTPEELVDRYHLQCRPVRDLIVDYLRERQPAVDYTSLKMLSYYLAQRFWADLEEHHPGIDSLHLPAEVADAWKQRQRTKPQIITAPDGERTVITAERIGYRQCLTPVRAFYLDLSQWAIEDPARWARWAAPCPVGQEEISQRKFARHRKARMDARTRERLPVLPVLVRTVDERRKNSAALLEAARRAQPGETFTAAGQTLTRSVTKAARKTWADDPAAGRRRDLELEDDHAFWAWAAVEVFRLTGCRIEEVLEISHHSLIQYRLPSTGEIVPLLQIIPSKTDEERLLVVSPELADVLSAIIQRIRQPDGSSPARPRLRPLRMRMAAAVPGPVPAPVPQRVPGDQRHLAAGDAGRGPRLHRPERPGHRAAAALHAARFPENLYHGCRHERPSAAYRAGYRGPQGYQYHYGLQGSLS